MTLRPTHRRPDTAVAVTVGELVRMAAHRHGGRVALVDGADPTRRWTWAELRRDGEDLARSLAATHRPGDVVAIWAVSEPAWVVLELASALAGLVVQPLDPALEPAVAVESLRRSGAVTLAVGRDVGGRQRAEHVEAARAALPCLRTVIGLGDQRQGPRAESLPIVDVAAGAVLLPTSGTTGPPKSALISHRALTTDARLVAARMGLTATDTWLTAMPLHRSGGCGTTVMACAATGAAMVFAPSWAPDAVSRLLVDVDATVFSAFPRALEALVAALDGARPTGRVRLVQTGGAPVAPALVRAVARSLGARLSVVYGMTEAAPVLTQTDQRDGSDDPAMSVGRPLPRTQLVVVDLDRRTPVATGVVGEVLARGPQLMDGYLGDEAATRRAIDIHGWLHTGDLGWLDGDGRLHVEGRVDDMVVRNGQCWLPGPVERAIVEVAGVADAVLVAGADGKGAGDATVAFVRRHENHDVDEAELRAVVGAVCGADKVPDRIVFVDEFPALPSGKVRRHVLRRWVRELVAA